MDYFNNYNGNGLQQPQMPQINQNDYNGNMQYKNPFINVPIIKTKKRNSKIDKINKVLKGVSNSELSKCGSNVILMNNMLITAISSIKTICNI